MTDVVNQWVGKRNTISIFSSEEFFSDFDILGNHNGSVWNVGQGDISGDSERRCATQ